MSLVSDWSSDVCSSDLMVGDDIELPAQCSVAQRPDADGALGRCRRAGDPGESNTEIKGSEGQEIEPLTGCNPPGISRSEERRVGKDCRSRWSRCPEKEK